MKKIEKEFFNAFKMVLGVGEGKAKTLAGVAMNVLLEQANKHSVKAHVSGSVCEIALKKKAEEIFDKNIGSNQELRYKPILPEDVRDSINDALKCKEVGHIKTNDKQGMYVCKLCGIGLEGEEYDNVPFAN